MIEQPGKITQDDIDVLQLVIPGLTRNPVFFWIPAFAGMTSAVVINDAVYRRFYLWKRWLIFSWKASRYV